MNEFALDVASVAAAVLCLHRSSECQARQIRHQNKSYFVFKDLTMPSRATIDLIELFIEGYYSLYDCYFYLLINSEW